MTAEQREQLVAQLRAEVERLRAEVEAFGVDLTELRLDIQASATVDDGSEAR